MPQCKHLFTRHEGSKIVGLFRCIQMVVRLFPLSAYSSFLKVVYGSLNLALFLGESPEDLSHCIPLNFSSFIWWADIMYN